jgi:hypothetical protein
MAEAVLGHRQNSHVYAGESDVGSPSESQDAIAAFSTQYP